MAERIPYFPIYIGDYLRQPQATCSIAAQGLYFRLKMIAHDSVPYGYLCEQGNALSNERAAKLCGLPSDLYVSLLTELRQVGVPDVTTDNVYFFKDMVIQGKKRAGNRERKQKERKRKNVTLLSRVTSIENENEDSSKAVVVQDEGVGEGAGTLPEKPYRMPKDPAGKLIMVYKILKTGSENKTNREWDARNWSRCAKVAPDLLGIFNGNWDKAIDYMDAFKAYCEKQKLDWTMETMVTKYDDWRSKIGF